MLTNNLTGGEVLQMFMEAQLLTYVAMLKAVWCRQSHDLCTQQEAFVFFAPVKWLEILPESHFADVFCGRK